ncbi:hypothetical protein DEO72_LG8g1673 [Vigna unguiculata]|uniref:Uncharacterized protein n=1 Tax=Vigna unguiculata TaxID=3917 RepID=A0A4D6MRG8_VIGUN|nr:hypothetical protein DEO72_LG8g1673 [Vigna unguiculata]
MPNSSLTRGAQSLSPKLGFAAPILVDAAGARCNDGCSVSPASLLRFSDKDEVASMVDDTVVAAARNLEELQICGECLMANLHGCVIVQIQWLCCCFAFLLRCYRFVQVRGSLTGVVRRWCCCEHGCRCGTKMEVLS